MIYSTGSHSRYYHRYHIVWVTKYRYKVLRGEMRERIRTLIRQTCNELGVHIEKGVLSTDHVHMFVSVPPHVPNFKGDATRKREVLIQDTAGVPRITQTLLGATVLG